MAATLNYFKWPQIVKTKELDKYTLLTDKNKGSVITQGRIFYCFKPKSKTEIQYCGYNVYYPCLLRGRYNIEIHPGHKTNRPWNLNVFEDHDREDWKSFWLKFIKDGISEKILYIKQEDPILKVYKL